MTVRSIGSLAAAGWAGGLLSALTLIGALECWATGDGPGADTKTKPAAPPEKESKATKDFGWFKWTPPSDWKPAEIPHGNSARKAQYQLPPPPAQEGVGELIVYHFGRDQGGGVDANLTRWQSQFERVPGTKDEDFAQTSKQKVDGLDVSILEVRGNFLGAGMPGAAPEPKKNDWMLLAAIVETQGGSYYIKTLGPRATLEHWKKAWHQSVLGLKAGKGA